MTSITAFSPQSLRDLDPDQVAGQVLHAEEPVADFPQLNAVRWASAALDADDLHLTFQ